MRMRPSVSFLVAGLFWAAGSFSALAQDAPEDAASLVRKARTAETVDRDVEKAIKIYREAIAMGGGTDAVRDASLRLMEILESRGDLAGALEQARLLSDKFSSRLDDDGKRRVHETMARSLPAGSHARSPLGDVYVLPAASPGASATATPAAASPLEKKILDILSRLDAPGDGNMRRNVENEVTQALSPVGVDALPVLERVMNGERPERAQFAARAYASLGQAAAIPGLVKAVREGDGFARASAIDGLARIQVSPEISPLFVTAVGPLLDLPQVKGRRAALLTALTYHLSTEELLKLHEAGGPDATYWLGVAVGRKDATAIRRTGELARQKGPLPEGLVGVLEKMAGSKVEGYGTGDGPAAVPHDDRLSGELRLAALEAVVAQPLSWATLEACASIAGAIQARGSTEDAARGADLAWRHVLGASDAATRGAGMDSLAKWAVPLPGRVLEDAALRAAYFEALPTAIARTSFQSSRASTRALLGPQLFTVPGFWAGVAEFLGKNQLQNLTWPVVTALTQGLGDELPPRDVDATWIPVLDSLVQTNSFNPSLVFVRASARSGDPKFLEFVRRRIAAKFNNEGPYLVAAIGANYRGPGLSEFTVDLLTSKDRNQYDIASLLAVVRKNPEFWTLLLDRIEKLSGVEASETLNYLARVTGDATPPAELAARTVALVRRQDLDPRSLGALWLRSAAGSPEYSALVRELATSTNPRDAQVANYAMAQLRERKPAERREILISLLLDPRTDAVMNTAQPGYAPMGSFAFGLLVQDDAPEAKTAVRRLAADPLAPVNHLAVAHLAKTGDRAALIPILESQATAEVPAAGRWEWRESLIDAAKSLHLREAIPFLLHVYQGGQKLDVLAAGAMDEIRAYHERLATFEAYAKGGEGGRKQLAALLKDEDPEIRRAAVLSLGAMSDKDALPALVKIAKSETNPRVRAAALEAVERIARAATATPPSGTAPVPAPTTPTKPEEGR